MSTFRRAALALLATSALLNDTSRELSSVYSTLKTCVTNVRMYTQYTQYAEQSTVNYRVCAPACAKVEGAGESTRFSTQLCYANTHTAVNRQLTLTADSCSAKQLKAFK
jgi:hypothetical protein